MRQIEFVMAPIDDTWFTGSQHMATAASKAVQAPPALLSCILARPGRVEGGDGRGVGAGVAPSSASDTPS
jgi:hypothetical protein